MPHTQLQHTADIRMHVAGKTLEELFESALFGMMGILNREAASQKVGKSIKSIKLNASDPTALLIDFLNEALYLAYTEKEIYTAVNFKNISETEVEAELEGASADSFDEDIKAATYHEAEVKKNERGEWETIIIFDI